MLYCWWIYSVVAPIVVLDILLRASPLYVGAWPIGLDHLAGDY